MHSLFLLFSLFIFLPIISTKQNLSNNDELFKIENIGLHFNYIGNVRLSNTQFTLLIHLNLMNLTQNYESLLKLFAESQNLCTHHKTSATHNHVVYYCQNSFDLLTIRLNKLKSKIEIINDITGFKQEHNIRKKRGVLMELLMHSIGFLESPILTMQNFMKILLII